MEKSECKSGMNIKKMHPFIFPRGMGKRVVFQEWQMWWFWVPEFIPSHKKCLQEKKNAIFGWLMGALSGIWLVCGWCDWFVSSLWVVWTIYGWFGWFVDGLGGLWGVGVGGGVRVLQLTTKCWYQRKSFNWKNSQFLEQSKVSSE